MYDMYRWDHTAPTPAGRRAPDGRSRPGRQPSPFMRNGAARPAPAPAAQAVQVALDRRDNGGDPASAPGQ
ncbi:MAG TPA: hypothetical protein VIX86_03850 [Streptosporangiaceae bacterium]